MAQNVWFIAALWMSLAFAASLISIWTGISVALIEIFVGVVARNFLGVHATTEWINFLALLGSGVLTFLAGAEIDPRSLKANLRVSGLIGVLSFGVPFIVIWLFTQFVLHWPLHQAQIARIALSTTSVAVVYAVMIEGHYSDTAMGKSGFYFAVLREGEVTAGDLIELLARDQQSLTVADIVNLYSADASNQDVVRRASKLTSLPIAWRDYFRKRLWKPDN